MAIRHDTVQHHVVYGFVEHSHRVQCRGKTEMPGSLLISSLGSSKCESLRGTLCIITPTFSITISCV
jgi:hypothetical protein